MDTIDNLGTAPEARILDRLKSAFPLEARVQASTPAVRTIYAQVLRHWIDHAAPPTKADMESDEFRCLVNLDALVSDQHGVGCYPFSARTTGIEVLFADKTLQAMCAIDALAISHLLGRVVTIRASCKHCDAPILLTQDSDGKLMDTLPNEPSVIWRKEAKTWSACAECLCPGINFQCADCARIDENAITLAQANSVAQAFFAFQRILLEQIPRRGTQEQNNAHCT